MITKLKMGVKREDGMIFWGFQKTCKDGEWWVSSEKFESLMNKAKDSARLRYAKNPDFYKSRVKSWQEKNPDRVKKYKRKHEQLNRLKISEKKKLRLQKDPIARFKTRLRTLIKNSFLCANHRKISKTSEILGCRIEYFKNYMESLFVDGMTWDNHGTNGWHIDHIIPISSAKTEAEILKLNHYTNLQPLWAADNIRKGNKIQ
jgi:hypothetical protein